MELKVPIEVDINRTHPIKNGNQHNWVVATQISFIFTPGETIQFDEHIFQIGWFNHQPDNE